MPVHVLAFAHLGPVHDWLLIGGSQDRTLWIWSGPNVTPSYSRTDHDGPITGLAADPRGEHIVVATGLAMASSPPLAPAIRILNLAQFRYGPHQRVFLDGLIAGTEFNRTGDELLYWTRNPDGTGGHVGLLYFDAQDREVLSSSDPIQLSQVQAATWIGSKRFAASTTTHLYLSAGDDAIEAAMIEQPAIVRTLAGCSRDHRFVGGLGRELHRWRAEAPKKSTCLGCHEAPICAVAYRSDGHRIASGDESGTIKIWDPLHPILEMATGVGAIRALAFAPDRTVLAVAGESGVALIDLD